MLTSIRCEVYLNFEFTNVIYLGQSKKRARANGARLALLDQLGIEVCKHLNRYNKS